METKELTTHQRGIILRGISGGAALKGKSPHISENNTVITCAGKLNVWDILLHQFRCRGFRAESAMRL